MSTRAAGVERRLNDTDSLMRLVRRAPVTVHLDTTLRVCAKVMTEESIGAVLVMAGHGPAGILSERDIVAAVAGGARVDVQRARDFMTADVDSLPESATIRQAKDEMLRNEIRHVAVTREDRTIGLISIRDVLAVRASG